MLSDNVKCSQRNVTCLHHCCGDDRTVYTIHVRPINLLKPGFIWTLTDCYTLCVFAMRLIGDNIRTAGCLLDYVFVSVIVSLCGLSVVN